MFRTVGFICAFTLCVAPTYSAELLELIETDSLGHGSLAQHFATRPRITLPSQLFAVDFEQQQDDSPYVYDQPDFVLNNKFAFLGEYAEIGPDIDWNGKYGRGDRELTWWINRFFYLECLQQQYLKTRDKRYPQHGIDLMLDWVAKNPIDQAAESWGSWRTLEIGLRLASWTKFIDFIATEQLISPAQLTILLKSLHEQTAHLVKHSGPGRGNWGFMEQAGIAMVAAVFPEFRESQQWADSVLKTYAIDVQSQFYPDGSQEEMSPNYEHTVVWSLTRVLYFSRERQWPTPPSLVEALKRSATYMALIHKPTGTLPMFNDGDAVDTRSFLKFVADHFDFSQLGMILGPHKHPDTLPQSCRLFPYSGIAMMRSGWDKDALCLMMDAGPFGTSHQHEDALGIDVCGYGRSFIVDPGRYTYAGGPMQAYLHNTRAHATITVDGGLQQRRKDKATWRSNDSPNKHFAMNDRLAWSAGTYASGYSVESAKDVQHVREVVFVDQRYWVICDTLLGTGRHRIDRLFQYMPGKVVVNDAVAVTQYDDANLALMWLPDTAKATVRTGEDKPTVGWYSKSYLRVQPAPHLTLSEEVELPVSVYTVLFPYRGMALPKGLAIDKRNDDKAVIIHHDGQDDVIRFVPTSTTTTQPAIQTDRIAATLDKQDMLLQTR